MRSTRRNGAIASLFTVKYCCRAGPRPTTRRMATARGRRNTTTTNWTAPCVRACVRVALRRRVKVRSTGRAPNYRSQREIIGDSLGITAATSPLCVPLSISFCIRGRERTKPRGVFAFPALVFPGARNDCNHKLKVRLGSRCVTRTMGGLAEIAYLTCRSYS